MLLAAAAVLGCAARERASSLDSGPSGAPSDITFERRTLATEFFCEGAHFADLDRDGHSDVIAGPYWYQGPDLRTRHELLPPVAVHPAGYSEHFFVWPRDIDGDGWVDLLTVGFPGKSAQWLRNPLGSGGRPGQHWERFLVHDKVDNESPTFVDLTGDTNPELVFHSGGRFGFVTPVPGQPRAPWQFHPISAKFDIGPFTHGLGVGDVDGDARADVLWNEGWLRQPESLDGDPIWKFESVRFSSGQGGAQIFVRDVDGDKDGDVITSLAAHGFGLSWFEQVQGSSGARFVEHRLMGARSEEHAHGVCFSELHALDVADVDGDGLDDIVTGKRWWSHGAEGDPQPGAPPLVAYFKLVRRAGGADFVPYVIDEAAGVGVQLVTGDVDLDGLRDIVVGSKRGVYVLFQRRKPAGPSTQGAKSPTLDFEDGDLRGWTASGDAFALQPLRGDLVRARGREPSLHQGELWIGGYERLGDGPVGQLTSDAFVVEQPWASFLVGGGADDVGVEIVLATPESDGKSAAERILFRTAGANYESMQRVVVDLSAHVGRHIFVRLVDQASGGWGHINFDDFRFHQAKPTFERPAGVPQILPLDEVKHAGLSATQAARAMELPAGFRVDVIAAEPDLHQPIALAVDDRGRLWVAEAFTYPKRQAGERGSDNIVVFEDEDHDGRFERRTVFLSGLNLVSGLEVGFGGVWIGAAPYLLFVPDRDADLVPDGPQQILLDGWGLEDTHETLNTFTFGPDGWLYGCHGIFTHSRVGRPGTPDAQRTPLNAGLWRFHPTRQEFEVFAFGTSNPWGVDFDAHGQAFLTACVIPHLFHAVQGGRYIRQAGSHFDAHAYGNIDTIADHRHYLGEQPHSGNNRSNASGGGHAHCGLVIYGEDLFPTAYRGALLFGNIHGNRINQDVLERKGSGFVGKHAPDFLLANDKWFRGINLRSGPDGALYVIDWYDRQACHLTTPEVWDRSNGRLYRISYGTPKPAAIDLAKLDSKALVELQSGSSEWHARRARRLLQERGPDAQTEQRLLAQLREAPSDVARLRSLWALHGLGAVSEALAREQMHSPHEYLRAWAIQLALEDRQVEPDTLASLERLAASDPSPVVRLYLASSLQRLPLEQRFELGRQLAARGEDENDANIPLLLWYGVEPLVAHEPARALDLFQSSALTFVARACIRRAAASPKLHPHLVHTLAGANRESLPWMLEATQAGLADQRGFGMPAGWPALYERLLADSRADVRERAATLAAAFGDPHALANFRATLSDSQSLAAHRLQALEALVRARDPQTAPLLLPLLDDERLRGPALRALSTFEHGETAAAILKRYATLGVEERRDALNALSSRGSYAQMLLDAVAAGTVPRSDLGAFVARKLESLDDPPLAARLAALWGRVRPTSADRATQIEALKRALSPQVLAQADRGRGRAVFARTCQQCHMLFDSGGKVGPELTGSNRADLDYLLSNVVDPNAVVGKDYLATMIWTVDGRLLTGIQRESNESTVTLQSENETLVIARSEIEEQRLADVSTMPEGLLDGLSPEQIADLVAYLQGPEQVPLVEAEPSADKSAPEGELRKQPAGDSGAATAGKLEVGVSALAPWNGNRSVWHEITSLPAYGEGPLPPHTILGHSEAGLGENSFFHSGRELGDFRLSVEVLLVGDAGNSGIQFRSRVLENGDVAGYQADIGPDWWGKLYEEHGRGVLWPESGEKFVKKGEWNRYVIEARGHHIRTWINDGLCVDLKDEAGALRGMIALQVHSGGPTEVRFREFKLEILD